MSSTRAGDRTRVRGFKPYPAYKDSGVEWLGEIPAHWRESKVKFLGGYVNGYPFKPEEWSVDGLPIIRIQNLTDPKASFNRFAGTIDPRYRVSEGDILISWSASLGLFVWTEAEDAWLNQHIFKVELCEHTIMRDFFVWLGDWFIRELQKETHGSTMTHLTWGRFGGFRVEIPPAVEQCSIAAYLDRETARIDALVAKKARLIELLQEKRTTLITHAVTKGLDPNIPMNDSGVEWLGKIPALWEVKRIRDVADSLQTGPFGSQLHAGEYIVGGTPLINPANLENGEILADMDCTVDDATAARLAHHRLRANDILFARRGEMGRCGLAKQPQIGWLCGTGCLRLRTRIHSAEPPYLMRFLSTAGVRDWLQLQSVGSTMQNLNTSIIGRISILVPTLNEQHAIAAFLDLETARIDALITKVGVAIDLLREYRTALISAAVTGKIDVREDAA